MTACRLEGGQVPSEVWQHLLVGFCLVVIFTLYYTVRVKEKIINEVLMDRTESNNKKLYHGGEQDAVITFISNILLL